MKCLDLKKKTHTLLIWIFESSTELERSVACFDDACSQWGRNMLGVYLQEASILGI